MSSYITTETLENIKITDSVVVSVNYETVIQDLYNKIDELSGKIDELYGLTCNCQID